MLRTAKLLLITFIALFLVGCRITGERGDRNTPGPPVQTPRQRTLEEAKTKAASLMVDFAAASLSSYVDSKRNPHGPKDVNDRLEAQLYKSLLALFLGVAKEAIITPAESPGTVPVGK